ncbi:MAG: CHASE2 domain-containing protein, partial [Pseudomonadota bacterium]
MERRPLIVLAFLTLLASFLVLLLRTLGLLEGAELKTYDAYLSLADHGQGPTQPLVMIEYTEADETEFGFPLPDEHLADLFEVLTAKGAVAIGLDLIRDRPEPKTADQSAFERLSQVMRGDPSIVGIVKGGTGAFGPPPSLADKPLQIASAAILPDGDETIRRGLLHISEGEDTNRPSLALLLAGRYLAANHAIIDWPAPEQLQLGEHLIRAFSPDRSGFYRQKSGVDGGFQFLLTFPACERGFERHRLGDLLRNEANDIDLQGRIVLVGNTVRSAKDVIDVPLDCADMDQGKMFGLHLHGHIISQLIGLANGSISPLEATEQKVGNTLIAGAIDGAWIWLWTVLGGLIALLLSSPLWMIGSTLAGLMVLTGSTFLLFSEAGWWLPVAPPALGFALALTFAIAYVMTHAKAEREHIMALFSGV